MYIPQLRTLLRSQNVSELIHIGTDEKMSSKSGNILSRFATVSDGSLSDYAVVAVDDWFL